MKSFLKLTKIKIVKVLKNIQYGENVIIEGNIVDIYGSFLRLGNCSFEKSPL